MRSQFLQSRVALRLLFLVAFLALSRSNGESPLADAPATFTLAYHITVAKPELPAVSRFLTAVYHPANVYLLDVPLTPDISLPAALEGAANIHVRKNAPPTPHGVSVALRTLSGMAFFLDWSEATHDTFDYFVNTGAHEYPTVTPSQMRALLYAPLARGLPLPNFMELSPANLMHLFRNNYDLLAYDPAIVFSQNASATTLIHTGKLHPDRRHRRRPYLPHSPSCSLIVSRPVARVFSDSMLSKRALLMLGEATDAALHFFPTVAADLGASAGPWVTTTSLHCTGAPALLAARRMPAHVAVADSSASIYGPCLFVQLELADSSDSRDAIDRELLDISVEMRSLKNVANALRHRVDVAISLFNKIPPSGSIPL